jgi:small nuclear ribonucleoprotein (snRNP)-like protein
MNLVLTDTVEVNTKKNSKTEIGTIMLKGENISLIRGLEIRAY